MRSVSGGHQPFGAGDARQGHGVPRAVLQLHRVHGRADQRRPVRDARRRGVLPTSLRGAPAVQRGGVHRPRAFAVAVVVVIDAAAATDHAPAAFRAAAVTAPAATALAVRQVRGAGVSRSAARWSRGFLQRRRRDPDLRPTTGPVPAPAKGPSQKAQTQRPGCHGRQYG